MRKIAAFMLALMTLADLGLLTYLFAEGRGSTITRGGLILLLIVLAGGWIFSALDLKKGEGSLEIKEWVKAEGSAEVRDGRGGGKEESEKKKEN
jgi:hypothetical protein